MNFLLTMAHPRKCGAIITNPPYKHADAFMRHAMFFCSAPGGPDVLALLFRNDFDTAKKREDAFRHPAFSKKLVLTKRPRWFPEKGPSPRHNYAWYIWDWREKNKPPTIEWKS